MTKMVKKIPIEIKAALLKYYFAEECSVQSLVKYALAKYDIDITRQSNKSNIGRSSYLEFSRGTSAAFAQKNSK